MKKVVKVTEEAMVLDDGSTVELLFELDDTLTLEDAQKIYEQALSVRNVIIEGADEITNS